MAQKSRFGWLARFAVLLIVFLFIALRTMARPKLNNNPFAIKQVKPSKWRGLVGTSPDGFLMFENPMYGVRAGFISLYQTYISKGFNTIDKIFDSNRAFPVYGDPGKGELYTKLVEKYSGIERSKKLSTKDLLKVGRGIERVENGKAWVSDSDFLEGYQSAMAYLGLSNYN